MQDTVPATTPRAALPGAVRLVQADDLAAAAIVDITAGVVIVRASLSPAQRRRAIRDALRGWPACKPASADQVALP